MIETTSLEQSWRCRFSNGDLGIVADTTADHGGSDSGIRPRELLEASLATCMNITVRIVAERDGIDLEEVTSAVHLDRRGDQETFRYKISFEGISDAEANMLQAAAEACPVQETLTASVAIERVEDVGGV